MSGRSKAAEAAAASKIRLVLCECEKCKAADPEGKGRMVRQWEKTEHEKAQAIAQAASKSITSIRGRGRGRGSAASGSRRPGTVGFRGRGRAAYLAAPFSSSSGSHTLVGLPQAVNPSVQENDIHQPSELPRPIFEPVPEAAGIQHHLGHHVSFRACNILLFCLNAIFLFLNLITIDNQMPVNLGTVLKKLELGDRFVVYPICHLCHRIFRPDIPTTAVCPDCDSALFKVSSSTVFERIKRRPAPAPTPVCAAPIQVLSSLLVDFLSQPRNEDALEEWKTRTHEPGKYKDIMDGNIWRSMKCPDGSLFFDPSDDSGELRLGVTLSLDWFGRKTSVYGPSHSSGALSFSVSNLPPALRYRAANLLLAAMTPGPTEPSAEQLQHYLKIIVDDLIKLYETGISIKTASRPEGRPIRVVLLGVICDHPAMCKMCGFADHAHTVVPCPKCPVPLAELYSDRSLCNEYPARDGEEHRRQSYEWMALETKSERGDYFKENGVRWTELARLPYLDLVRSTVIDPMHNLLLGIVKTQWYSQWIKENALRRATTTQGRELDVVHQFLETFESPLWAGKLPLRVGEPAGGSLSADEYKFAAITALPIIIPIVWDLFEDEAVSEFQSAQSRYETAMKVYDAALEKWNASQAGGEPSHESRGTSTSAPEPAPTESSASRNPKKRKINEKPTPPKPPSIRMHSDEASNFLRLATALKIILSSSIDEAQLDRAETLLEEYLLGFKELYGADAMKPNHHWSRHIINQIRDLGPVYSFWTFVSERLNKLLKNFNSNSWKGGQMEISMMRYFGRDALLHEMIEVVANSPENSVVRTITSRLLGEGMEARGTVEDAPNSTAIEDSLSRQRVQPGTVAVKAGVLSDTARAALYHHYNAEARCVRYALDRDVGSHLPILSGTAQFYNYALLEGRRITPSSRTLRKSAGSSLVSVRWNGEVFGGEVERIFHHNQPGINADTVLFAEVRWMKYIDLTAIEADPWNEFPELEIEFWAVDEFWPAGSREVPPVVIPFDSIRCQLSRGLVETTEPSLWVTTSMDRHAVTISDE